MKSIQRTVLVWTTALLSAVSVAAFAVSYEAARSEATEFLDGQLRQIALNAGAGVSEALPPQEDEDREIRLSVNVWDARSGKLKRSAGASLPQLDHTGFGIVVYSGEPWRVFLARDDKRIVEVGQRMVVQDEIAQTAGLGAAAPILVAIPLLWIVLALSLSYALRPLARTSAMIAERDPHEAGPLRYEQAPAEIAPLLEAMNRLTLRLQDALLQQRRFLSDAAHQLRTPMAALRIQLENLVNETGVASEAVRDMRRGIERSSSLVDQMLRMARLESPLAGDVSEDVDLASLVADCVAEILPLAESKKIDVGLDHQEIGRLRAAEEDLRLLFGNLIENAVRYTPPGGSVDVLVHSAQGCGRVDVFDTGPGVADEYLPRLFERFFRAAPPDAEGAGLGLAIAKAVAERYGLSLELANRIGGPGLRASVLIPERLLILR